MHSFIMILITAFLATATPNPPPTQAYGYSAFEAQKVEGFTTLAFCQAALKSVLALPTANAALISGVCVQAY